MIILSKKIFKYIMLVSSMVTVLGLAFVIGILSHSFQRQLMNELKKEAVFISRGVEAAGTDYLDQLSNTDSRITYVDESGKVLYDNEADVENMENHGHRKEKYHLHQIIQSLSVPAWHDMQSVAPNPASYPLHFLFPFQMQ